MGQMRSREHISHESPFVAEGNKLYNIITDAYISDEHVPHILNAESMVRSSMKTMWQRESMERSASGPQ